MILLWTKLFLKNLKKDILQKKSWSDYLKIPPLERIKLQFWNLKKNNSLFSYKRNFSELETISLQILKNVRKTRRVFKY